MNERVVPYGPTTSTQARCCLRTSLTMVISHIRWAPTLMVRQESKEPTMAVVEWKNNQQGKLVVMR